MKTNSPKIRCEICSNEEHFMSLSAEIEARQIEIKPDGSWQRVRLRMPKPRVTASLCLICSNCGSLVPRFPTETKPKQPR